MRRGAAARGSNKKGAAAGGPAPPIELYTETNIWSKYYRLWTRWHVKKPRLPLLAEDNPETARWVDLPKNKPPFPLSGSLRTTRTALAISSNSGAISELSLEPRLCESWLL